MDAVKFVEERNRLCDMYPCCSECPAKGKVSGCKLSITSGEEAEKQIELVEKWSAEHPQKTRQDVFLEQYPETRLDDSGVLSVCPAVISLSYRKDDGGCVDSNKYRGCAICRKEFWTKGVE